MVGTYEQSGETSTLFLARHGRTELNAAGALRGRLDPPLDEVGRSEAGALAKALAPFEPTVVVASPLRRAVETAERIAQECGLDVEIDEQLIDRDYGEWSGRRLEEVVALFGSVDKAPGVEPRFLVVDRAIAALDAIAERASDAAVVVAHDAINRLVISAIDPDRYGDADGIGQHTGCFNLLQRSGESWTVMKVDIAPLFGTAGGMRS